MFPKEIANSCSFSGESQVRRNLSVRDFCGVCAVGVCGAVGEEADGELPEERIPVGGAQL